MYKKSKVIHTHTRQKLAHLTTANYTYSDEFEKFEAEGPIQYGKMGPM